MTDNINRKGWADRWESDSVSTVPKADDVDNLANSPPSGSLLLLKFIKKRSLDRLNQNRLQSLRFWSCDQKRNIEVNRRDLKKELVYSIRCPVVQYFQLLSNNDTLSQDSLESYEKTYTGNT
ncbi:unnamed protein product [Heligmosomoides polygyrus]|uniref:Uncharacterized protein n=1 Tax=Heligmosomoides polygyrus TaxID=6339 RepID=A0A3P8B1A0_HELPZ|nr:unnamed protein product [Heligmosomoides polygyrus]